MVPQDPPPDDAGRADEAAATQAGGGSSTTERLSISARVRAAIGFLPGPVRWIVVAVVGGSLIIAGIAMLVLPGPGLLTVFAGVAVLAAEFTWAEILLRRMKAAGTATWSLMRRKPRE